MVVVLPAPFGPSSAKISPRMISRSMPLTASIGPYLQRSPRTRMACSASAAGGDGDGLSSVESAFLDGPSVGFVDEVSMRRRLGLVACAVIGARGDLLPRFAMVLGFDLHPPWGGDGSRVAPPPPGR